MTRKHRYVSNACLHGIHSLCRDGRNVCDFCGESCHCTALECHQGSHPFFDNENRDYELQQRLAVAIHDTPGFIQGETSPWAIAESVLKTLRDIPPKENEDA